MLVIGIVMLVLSLVADLVRIGVHPDYFVFEREVPGAKVEVEYH